MCLLISCNNTFFIVIYFIIYMLYCENVFPTRNIFCPRKYLQKILSKCREYSSTQEISLLQEILLVTRNISYCWKYFFWQEIFFVVGTISWGRSEYFLVQDIFPWTGRRYSLGQKMFLVGSTFSRYNMYIIQYITIKKSCYRKLINT